MLGPNSKFWNRLNWIPCIHTLNSLTTLGVNNFAPLGGLIEDSKDLFNVVFCKSNPRGSLLWLTLSKSEISPKNKRVGAWVLILQHSLILGYIYNTQDQKLHWHQLQSRLSDYHGTSFVEQLSETWEFPFGIFSWAEQPTRRSELWFVYVLSRHGDSKGHDPKYTNVNLCQF